MREILSEKVDKYLRNRIECAESDPHIYGNLIFNKGKRKFSGKSIVFSTNITRTFGYSYDKMDFKP